MHPRENGFVLVIGLALLTIATGMVVAGMSLGRYQERQAGHYLRTNDAQLGADEAFLHLLHGDMQWARDIRQYVNEQLIANAGSGTTWKPGVDDMSTTPWRDRRAFSPSQYTRPMVESIEKLDEDTVRVTFSGSNWVDGNDQNVGFSSFQADFNVGGGDEPGGAYREVLLGCEGVSLSGSGRIDSYDSRKGAYGANLGVGEYNRDGTQGLVSTNADENGNVTLSGSSPIYGQVRAAGNVTASGSASIHGDIQANGDVIISGGGSKILGNVASRQAVRLTSSGTVTGNVEANTEIVTGNWSSRIEGNATAPRVRTTTNRDVSEQVGGTINRGSPNVAEISSASCDSFTTREGATIGDLRDALALYASSGSLSIGGGNQTYTLKPSGLQVPSDRYNNAVPNPDRYRVTRDVTVDGVFPEPTNVLVLDSFSLGGSANFVVDGGDMTLYVKGNIDIGGGATFNVAEGSSLKIVTEGRFNLPSGLDIASDSVTNDEGNPILSLYSTYDDGGASGWNAGVNITGSSTFKGTIFAPYSTVNVAGSGELFGAVKGRRVDISGSGDIHYDEALMESTIGTGGGESGGGVGGSWTLEGLSYGNPEE
nr:putative acyltransferase [Virgibacillus halodenitrificans]